MPVIFYKTLKRFSAKQLCILGVSATNFGHLIKKSSAYFCSDCYSENVSWIGQSLYLNSNFGITQFLAINITGEKV